MMFAHLVPSVPAHRRFLSGNFGPPPDSLSLGTIHLLRGGHGSAFPIRNEISVQWIRILGAAVVAGLVVAVAGLDSRVVVDMAAEGVAVVTKEYV